MLVHSRQLVKAEKDKKLSFTYDSEGIRTSKTVGSTTTKYLLNGTQILAQTTNGITTSFFYDQQGNRVAMADSGNHFYYYIYNLQGDVIALADASTGKLAVTYTYDAWGKLMELKDTTANSVGTLNPFRYRGYYYDTETSLYYLQTRYYDPEVGRFINADAFASTDISGALSANMFAYCENNPVMRTDPTGEFFATISGAIIGGIAGALGAMMSGDDVRLGAAYGAANGALCGVIADMGVLTGGAAVVVCGGIGVMCEYDKQMASGKTQETLDVGSIVLSGAFSALSCGLSNGFKGLMEGASTAAQNFVTAVSDTCTTLVGTGVGQIHNGTKKPQSSKSKPGGKKPRMPKVGKKTVSFFRWLLG